LLSLVEHFSFPPQWPTLHERRNDIVSQQSGTCAVVVYRARCGSLPPLTFGFPRFNHINNITQFPKTGSNSRRHRGGGSAKRQKARGSESERPKKKKSR
jgi:hypothetical protein